MIETLVVNSLSWILVQATDGVKSEASSRLFTAISQKIRHALSVSHSTPDGADITDGIRRVQMRALERVITDYRESSGMLRELGDYRDTFFNQALAFCRRSEFSAPARGQTAGEGQMQVIAIASADTCSVSSAADLVEDAVLGELRAQLNGEDFPVGFEEFFRGGGTGGGRRFMEWFGIYFGQQIKEDNAFRDLLNVRLLSHLAREIAGMDAALVSLDQRFSIDIAHLGKKLDETDERLRRIETLLNSRSDEKGIPISLLRTILNSLGESNVADEDIATRLAVMAEHYRELREAFLSPKVDFPEYERVSKEVMEMIDAGDTNGAQQLFIQARVIVRASREDRSREEAALLAGEADILRLTFNNLAAVNLYAEAEALVAAFDSTARLDYLSKRAFTIGEYGSEQGDESALEEAVNLWTVAVNLLSKKEAPQDWVKTEIQRVNSLYALGAHKVAAKLFGTDRIGGFQLLNLAVECYNAILEENTVEVASEHWVLAQGGLAAALQALGIFDKSNERLKEAAIVQHAITQAIDFAESPWRWVEAQVSFANTLLVLGQRTSNTRFFDHGLLLVSTAAEFFETHNDRYSWARAQYIAGMILGSWGMMIKSGDLLDESLQSLQASREEFLLVGAKVYLDQIEFFIKGIDVIRPFLDLLDGRGSKRSCLNPRSNSPEVD